MKKFSIFSAIMGMGFGFPITLLCMTLIGGFNGVIQEFLVWMIASALYGIVSGLFFIRKNNLSLPVAISLHCLCCVGITAAAAAICGYGSSFLTILLSILPVFVVVYVLVYAVCFYLMKNDEKMINRALEE